MTANQGGTGGRSRRLAALSLDDEAGAAHVVPAAGKTVPLAVYGGSASGAAGTTGAKVGSTTAPLAAQSAPPVSAVATPSIPTPSMPTSSLPTPSGTGPRAALAGAAVNKVDDELEGPPMAKTPWGLIAGVGVVIVILGLVAAVVLGGSGKGEGSGGAAPVRSS